MKLGRYLIIKNVKLEDQGTYVCIAYNPYGKIKREIKLVVQASNNTIRIPTGNAKSHPVSSTALSITAGEPTATRPSSILPPPKGSLRPSNIPLIDGRPPKFRNPSNRSSEYAQGSPIRLKCHAHGEPLLNVTWLKNGKRLGRADRTQHLKSKGWVLNFRELSLTDAGTYTCTVTNAFGSIAKTFAIKVKGRRLVRREHKPGILERVLKNVTAKTGDDASFVCSAISRSYPKFHFLKWISSKNVSNGSDPFNFIDFTKSRFVEIREAAKPHMGNRQVYTHRLIIRNVTLVDEAKYTCVVGNSAGWVSEHAFLTIQDEDYADDETGGSTMKQFTVTKSPHNPKAQADKEILVEEVPLAALIGVPVAVVILLIGTIVWCYFMTRKHRSQQLRKDEDKEALPQKEKNNSSSISYVPRGKEETRNVSFNVYVDCPNDRVQLPRMHDKHAPGLQQAPPLDGLVVLKEPSWTHSKRTDHRKCHEREEHEFSESEIKCSGV